MILPRSTAWAMWKSSNMHDGGICDVMGTTWRIAEGLQFCNQKYENISLPEGTALNISGVDLLLTPANKKADGLCKCTGRPFSS